MNHPKVQHYVPRFLLRGFGRGKKSQFWTFDKLTGRTFKTHPGNVAAVSGYYDLDDRDGLLTLEPALAELEGAVSKLVREIRRARSIKVLTDTDRSLLALFMAVQHLRTPLFREQAKHVDEAIQERLGPDVESVENYRPFAGDEEVKSFAIRTIEALAPQLAQPIFTKVWILVETKPSHPFWISDHPLALNNERDFGPRGNIGLAVPGIEIYLPLSDTLALLLSCPTNFEGLDSSLASAQRLRYVIGHAGDLARRAIEKAEPLVKALEDGQTLPSVPDNATFHNSLQVLSSERWVFSPVNDFGLAEEMIAKNPALKKGPRLQVM